MDGSILSRKRKRRPIILKLMLVTKYEQNITYWLGSQNTAQKVIEDLSNLRMAHDVFFTGFNQLFFPDGQVSKHLIVKIGCVDSRISG